MFRHDHIHHLAADPACAIEWYKHVFGASEIERHDIRGGEAVRVCTLLGQRRLQFLRGGGALGHARRGVGFGRLRARLCEGPFPRFELAGAAASELGGRVPRNTK